jgi:hypothetical protein
VLHLELEGQLMPQLMVKISTFLSLIHKEN